MRSRARQPGLPARFSETPRPSQHRLKVLGHGLDGRERFAEFMAEHPDEAPLDLALFLAQRGG